MSTLPKLTEIDIRNWVGEQSLAKGRPYFRDSSILNPRRQGDKLKAQCVGSAMQPYRVEITLGPNGISDGDCSCPVGAEGRCKHAAALLLAWVNEPQSFTEIEELRAALNKRSKEELVALLVKILDRHPELETLLELTTLSSAKSTKPLDPKVLERQIKNTFKGFDYEYGAGDQVAHQLADVKQLGDQYTATKDWRNAILVYKTLAEGVLDQYEMIGEADEEGELADIVNDCVTGLGEVLTVVKDAPLRETILRALFDIDKWDTDYGGIDMGYAAMDIISEQASAAEKHLVAQWVREAMPKNDDGIGNYRRQNYGGLLLNLEADILDDEAFLRICRESGRVQDLVERLLSLHRVEEALAEVQMTSDYNLLNMEESFATHEQSALFARLINARAKTSQDSRIKEWLKADATKRGDVEAILRYTEELFWARPSLQGYREVKSLAQQTKQWATLRPQFMEKIAIESRYQSLLISIHLAEGEIDHALKLVQTPAKSQGLGWGYFSSSMELEVAKAAEATRPQAALEIYLKTAKRFIAERNRTSYASAASLLNRVRTLYQHLGKENIWREFIAQMRTEHKALRALQDELNKAKL